MAKRYRCNRCGYIWKSDSHEYCLRCYSKDIHILHFFRDRVSGIFSGFRKRFKSTKSNASKKSTGLMDYFIDLWATIKGFIFIILVFILFIILAMIYLYWM